MILKSLKPRNALNKAFLKAKPIRSEIERFKANLLQLLERTNDTESEEFHKNIVSDFLKKTYYDPNHYINTKGRNDLVIHNGSKAGSTVGVIIEAKKPTNRSEMVTREKLNTKAFQELVLYYLRERITQKNLEVKYLIVTNITEWFIFDATIFDRHFAQNKALVSQFNDFESGRLSGSKTDYFYKNIAEPAIDAISSEIEFTWFDLQDYLNALKNADKTDDNKLIALFKLLSPEHLLKLPFTNDSNSLDKRFYSELLHLIGLTETKQGGKKLIERNKEGERNSGSLIEDTIIQLDSLDKIGRLPNAKHYGDTLREQQFNVALELSITWINRILFLKLLEAQLIKYHKGDASRSFLNSGKIKNYDDLNSLFFQVLARKHADRNADVKRLFEKVPYLNSSLFEPTELEHNTLFISNLKDDKSIPVYASTVLKNDQGKKKTGNLRTLDYLFAFLSAYDFSSEGSEEIQEDNKSLINASVLGLIFEKINGYKDGSFFTPGFITMYMCRETIRKAVVQKFNETNGWKCSDLDDVYDKIEDRSRANEIVNSIKICDPAVGSGHFLVSALNEMIAIKNDLRILQDRDGRRLKEYHFEVVNDELVITDEDGLLFEYNPNNRESQRVQETVFHEKQTIIENSLFGVDINPNSVKICRLRLWIELLKNAYYHHGGTATTKNSSPEKGRCQPPADGGVRLNNLPHLKTFRKNLRNNLTPAEAKLWTLLKGKALDGRKFRRQHSVANYILDFYCPEERLAIELDGQHHFEATQAELDYERDLFLNTVGIRVLRFENKVVWDDLEWLLDEVRGYFGKQQPPRQPAADTPPFGGGELIRGSSETGTSSGELLAAVPPNGELQTLPNIDINIKCGNSLVSRFALDADLGQALKKSKWTIDSYRLAVDTYRNAQNKEEKRAMEQLIADIKSDFRSEISKNDPKVKRLNKLSGELVTLTTQTSLFDQTAKEKKAWQKKVDTLTRQIKKLESEIEEIKANKIYENAFEWRFEFPEVLNEAGDFVGFDVVIGNPPYGVKLTKREKDYLKSRFTEMRGEVEIYTFFIELAMSNLLKFDGVFSFITTNTIYYLDKYSHFRNKVFLSNKIISLLELEKQVFADAPDVVPAIFVLQKNKSRDNIIKLYKSIDTKRVYDLIDFEGFIVNKIKQNKFQAKKNFVFSLSTNEEIENLLNNISQLDTVNKSYKVVYGIKTGDNDKFLSKEIIGNNNWKKCVSSANNIKKYNIDWQGDYLNVCDDLAGLNNINYEQPKILIQYIRKLSMPVRLVCAIDRDGEYYPLNNFSFIISNKGNSLKVLLGILNSKLMNWYFSNSFVDYNIKPKYIEQLPLPTELISLDLEKKVSEIISLKEIDKESDTTYLESQIDQLVYQLYGLTNEEIEIVEASTK